jgi:hypothetical protein
MVGFKLSRISEVGSLRKASCPIEIIKHLTLWAKTCAVTARDVVT